MNRVTVICEMVGRHDQKTYKVGLDIQLKALHVEDEAAAVGDIIESVGLAPGQSIPDGDYTKRPHQFEAKDKRVRVQSGRMYAGWLK